MHTAQTSFKGSWFRQSGHLETILPALFRRIHIPYRRERLELPDGDFLDIDTLRNNNKRMVVLLHGLEGSAQSAYIKGMAHSFVAQKWDVVAVNFRSCSGEMNRLLSSYHSGATQDLDFVVQYIHRHYAYDHLALIGFSLGGNVLLKYLGELHHHHPANLQAAVAISVPVDLGASALQLASFQNSLYMRRFLRSLKHKMKMKALQFPGQIDLSGLESIRDFYAFDDQFTAPMHGFRNAQDYYDRCSSVHFLGGITVPTLLLNAFNDPFLTPECFPAAKAALQTEYPQYGGHAGFAQRLPNGLYWSEQRALNFITKTIG
ncbi:MAG: alpha/beta fold hydrolase [Bacteroidia bacterium]|jgi:hypothetical protein